jgi:uncharacterized protein (DUF2336 family)
VARADAPLRLLNDIFFLVAQDLRRRILDRNAVADAETLAELSTATRRRRNRIGADMSDDIRRANVFVQLKRADGALTPKLLVGLMRDRQHARFLCGFAELSGVALETVQKIVARKDADALALICRASDIDSTTFATLASLILGETDASCGRFLEIYNNVPVEGGRVMLQHRERAGSADRVAA